MKKLQNSCGLLVILLTIILLSASNGFSQTTPNPPDWNIMMFQPNANFYSIKNNVDAYFNTYPERKEFEENDENEGTDLSYINYQRWLWFWKTRVDDGTSEHSGSFSLALQNYRQSFTNSSIYSCHQSGGSNNLNSNWTQLGPYSFPCQNMGAIFTLEFDPTDATHNTLYAGTGGSGIWRTTNAQSSNPIWTSLQDVDGEPGTGIGDIVFANQGGVNTIYVSSGTRRGGYFGVGVFKSTNNGQTWQQTSLTLNAGQEKPIFKLLVDPSNPYIIWAYTPNELYRMDEANGTNQVAFNYISTQGKYGGRSSLIDIEFDPNNPNIVYASSSGYSPVSAIETFFGSGIPIPNQGASINKIVFNGGSFTSQDITPNPTAGTYDFAWCSLATCPLNPNEVIAMAVKEVSVNSFTQTKNKFIISTSTWQSPVSTSGQATPTFFISPVDQNIYYAAGGGYGYKSINAGLSWSTITNYGACAEHGDVRYIMQEQTNVNGISGNDVLWMGTDGGLSRKYLSSSWVDKSGTGLNNLEFYGIGGYEGNANLIMAGAQDNNVNKWTNPTWQHLGTGDGGECIIDYTNQNHMYAPSGYQSMCESTNGWSTLNCHCFPPGNCCSQCANPDVWWLGMNMKIDLANPNIVYVPSYEVFKYNAGVGFQYPSLSLFSNGTLSNVGQSESNPNVMYVGHGGPSWVSNPPNVFHVTNNLQSASPTWTDLSSTFVVNGNTPFSWTSMSDIAVKPTDQNTLWVTFSAWWATGSGQPICRVVKSTNGGLTWSDESAGLPNFQSIELFIRKVVMMAYTLQLMLVFITATTQCPNGNVLTPTYQFALLLTSK
jgi:hypothetical protein